MNTIENGVWVNGGLRPLGEAGTLAELFAALGVEAAGKAVERNGVIVPVAALGGTPVVAGDRIEIIQFVGGG